MLGDRGLRKFGAKNITIVASILVAYVFGTTAWGQAGDVPTGVRLTFAIIFALGGAGAIWLLYLAGKLLLRLFRGPRAPSD